MSHVRLGKNWFVDYVLDIVATTILCMPIFGLAYFLGCLAYAVFGYFMFIIIKPIYNHQFHADFNFNSCKNFKNELCCCVISYGLILGLGVIGKGLERVGVYSIYHTVAIVMSLALLLFAMGGQKQYNDYVQTEVKTPLEILQAKISEIKTPSHRQIIEKLFLENKTAQEVSDELSYELGTVYNVKSRYKIKLNLDKLN